MLLEPLFHIANHGFNDFVKRHRNIESKLINLIQAFTASLLEGMLDIVEGLVDLLREGLWDFLREAFPAA